ncbi:MAG: DUF3784 domain-containing protein [Oscillospiraceae bacterium]|nr:DUF3784 domain-containing protein [Oscillospiraceae bacterium]
MIAAYIIIMLVGLALIVMGLLIWKKQMTGIIAGYHQKSVQEPDVPAYTRLIGIGLLIMGVGVCLTGIINLAFQTGLGWIAYGVGLVTGMWLIIKAQRKYNGSLIDY